MNVETPQGEYKKDYELAFLLVNQEDLKAVLEIFRQHKIVPYYQSQVNQVKLAYSIKEHESAFLGFFHFESLPEAIINLKNDLSLSPSIIRFLIVTPAIKSPSREARYQGRQPESKPEQPATALSNEALEQKLEEILK